MDDDDDVRRGIGDPVTPDRSDGDETEDDTDGGFAPAPSRSQPSVGSKGRVLETVESEKAKPTHKGVYAW